MRNSIRFYLNRAHRIAQNSGDDRRNYRLGAVGLRSDGTTVSSTNVSNTDKCSEVHAETRLSRKLDNGSTVSVARAIKNGNWANARPCPECRSALRNRGVIRVYYTIGPLEFGCIVFED